MNDLARLAGDICSAGTTSVFGVPGSGKSLELLDQLEKLEASFHLTHFEGSAAIMAGTTGRLTGRAGVSISIKGPGLANMLPGLAVCYLERFPLVAIAEAYHPDTPRDKAHKRMNQEILVSGVAKGSRFFSENGPGFHEIAAWAESEVSGPVLLQMPDKPLLKENSVPEEVQFHGSSLAGYIDRAKRPLVIAGTLAVRRGWSEWLNGLALPVFSTAAAKGVVNESFPHAAGVFTGAGLSLAPESTILPLADLIIGIGLHPNEVLLAQPFHCNAINVFPLYDDNSVNAFGFGAAGGSANIEELFEALAEKSWGLEEIQLSLCKMKDYLLSGSFLPAHAFNIIKKVFGSEIRIVLDTGNFCTVGEHLWCSDSAERFLSSGQSRYMGSSLPMGIAASLYDRNIPTAVVLGDGGIGPFVSEIKIAVQNRLPLIVMLMTDGRFASIRGRALKDGLTQKPLTVCSPSWISVMEGFKVNSFRVETADCLHHVLVSWDRKEGPLFIEIPFEPELYQQMVQQIR